MLSHRTTNNEFATDEVPRHGTDPCVNTTGSVPPQSVRKRARKAPPILPSMWEAVRERVRQLYLQDGLSLNEIMVALGREQDFHASLMQYKNKLSEWEFTKNVRKQRTRGVNKHSTRPGQWCILNEADEGLYEPNHDAVRGSPTLDRDLVAGDGIRATSSEDCVMYAGAINPMSHDASWCHPPPLEANPTLNTDPDSPISTTSLPTAQDTQFDSDVEMKDVEDPYSLDTPRESPADESYTSRSRFDKDPSLHDCLTYTLAKLRKPLKRPPGVESTIRFYEAPSIDKFDWFSCWRRPIDIVPRDDRLVALYDSSPIVRYAWSFFKQYRHYSMESASSLTRESYITVLRDHVMRSWYASHPLHGRKTLGHDGIKPDCHCLIISEYCDAIEDDSRLPFLGRTFGLSALATLLYIWVRCILHDSIMADESAQRLFVTRFGLFILHSLERFQRWQDALALTVALLENGIPGDKNSFECTVVEKRVLLTLPARLAVHWTLTSQEELLPLDHYGAMEVLLAEVQESLQNNFCNVSQDLATERRVIYTMVKDTMRLLSTSSARVHKTVTHFNQIMIRTTAILHNQVVPECQRIMSDAKTKTLLSQGPIRRFELQDALIMQNRFNQLLERSKLALRGNDLVA